MDGIELRKLIDLRRKRDDLKRDYDAANAEYREHEARLWAEMFESGDKFIRKQLGDPYGEFTFGRRQTIRGRILDMDIAEASFVALGREGELLKRGVEQRRLNELIKDYLERGEELPQGIDFTTTDYIAIGGLNDANQDEG